VQFLLIGVAKNGIIFEPSKFSGRNMQDFLGNLTYNITISTTAALTAVT